MTKFKAPLLSMLLICMVFSACIGQTKSERPVETGVEQPSFTGKTTKLTKTQGTTEHQNVHCSLQDKAGNLWFGTTGEGVYRYDGKEFTQFTEKDGLSNNKVWSILEDKTGNIWLGTDDGACLYDGKVFSKISFTPTSPSGFGTEVWSMMQDKNGTIWFGTSEDLYCYDGKTFSRFLDNYKLINNQDLQLTWIQCMLEDDNGIIWMGSGPGAAEGVIRFDGKSITSSNPNGDGWIRYIVAGANGDIWFSGRQNGVFCYDGQTFKLFTEKINIGSAIFKDRTGNIWFDGGERLNSIESIAGIWRYDGKEFVNFSTKDGMGKYSVWNMLEDKNGQLWIGTRNCGLYRYDGKTFETFSE
jgi:ligand-binding sensor domain-containing protein